MTTPDRVSPSQTVFIRQWMITSAIGVLATIPLLTLLPQTSQAQAAAPLVGGLALGLFLGGAQWLVLRRYFERIALWIAAAFGGALTGAVLGLIFANPMIGALTGMIAISVGQWLVLRTRVTQPQRWLIASGLGWSMSFIAAAIAALITSLLSFEVMMAEGGDPGPGAFLADQPGLLILIGLAAVIISIYPVLFFTGQAMWRFVVEQEQDSSPA